MEGHHHQLRFHLHLSRQNPLLLEPPTIITPKIMSLRFDTDDAPLRLSQTLHCPFRVVGSVDGLVLLSDDLHSSNESVPIILWNPSIRKSATLPMPRFTSYSEGPYLGFGMDSATGSYKVVRFVYHDMWPPCRAEVYSLRDRSWRTVISDNVYDVVPSCCWTQCFIHNAVHWIAGRKEPGQKHSHQEVLLFDLGTEVFKKMALPELPKVHSTLVSILVVGGLLTVSAHPFILNNQTSDMDIWVKTDYYTDLWTKIATLNAWKLHVGEWLDVRRLCLEIPTGSGGGARDSREIQVPASYSLLLEKSAVDRYVLSYTESLVLLDE